MLFLCVLLCDFSVVSDDIWHCSVLCIAAVCVQNDRKSCDFAVKHFVL